MAGNESNSVTKRRRGTRQQDRLMPALSPDYVSVDEKSLAQNLQFIYNYSRLVKLYDPQNSLYGSWQWMLQNDNTFTLATLATTDLNQFPNRYNQYTALYQNSYDSQAREIAISELFGLTSTLGMYLADWVGRSKLVPEDSLNLVDQLSEPIRTNLGYSLGYYQACLMGLTLRLDQSPASVTGRNLQHEVSAILNQLGSITGLPPSNQLPNPPFDTLDNYFTYLQQLYKNLYRSCKHIQINLTHSLDDSLTIPNHTPHSTLLITFAQLMEKAQASMNTVTAKHLQFYYQKVLQLNPNPPQPDQVRVLFELKKGLLSGTVPAQSALNAGKGTEGEDLIYLTQKTIEVNTIEITQIKTIFNSGINGKIPGEGMLYAAPIANSGDGLGGKYAADEPAQWSPFGTDQAGLPSKTMEIADIGFAISDPVLFLSMGKREVAVYVSFSTESTETLNDNLTIFKQKSETLADTFERVFQNAFMVAYSAPKGWQEIAVSQGPTYFSPAFPLAETQPSIPDNTGFWLSISPGLDLPAISECEPAVHGPGYAQGQPVLRLVINQLDTTDQTIQKQDSETSITIAPYNLLRQYAINQIDVQVSVAGKTDFTIQNNTSALEIKKPFQIFGPTPELGSALYIGSPEAFRKQLKSLRLQISWVKLPIDATGFAGYYDSWNEVLPETPFHNALFRIGISILQNRQWVSLPPSPIPDSVTQPTDFPMYKWAPAPSSQGSTPTSAETWLIKNLSPADPTFEADLNADIGPDGTLLGEITWDQMDLSAINDSITQIPATSLDGTFSYSSESASGFLKVSLTAPAYGFGSQLFQNAVTAVNNQNILQLVPPPTDSASVTFLATPKPPYVPQAHNLSLSYSASSTWVSGKNNAGNLHYIQPLGVTLAQSDSADSTPLLPNYSNEGELFLGLANVLAPQTLTILFEVNENSAADNITELPKVNWSYLYQGKWQSFKSVEIVADGTKNFTQSGIIEFMLNNPPTDDGGWFNSVKNSDTLLWIRGSVAQNTAATCKVIYLNTQAVTATYVVGPSVATHLAAPLPAGSIKKLQNPISEIAKINQPFDSFGGREGETDAQYFTRIHERLRHKQRGITAWDIERILLEAFPDIELVNCFNHSNAKSSHVPGKARVIVFPGNGISGQPNPFTPKFNLSQLEAMESFLLNTTPQELKAVVANPTYEFLEVRATVNFMPGLDPGHYLAQLNTDLCNYISPWATDSSLYNPYDTLLSPALIRGFMNGLEYLEGVKEFQVYQFRMVNGSRDYDIIIDEYTYFEPHKSWNILTTVSKHLLGDADSAEPLPELGMVIGATAKNNDKKHAQLGFQLAKTPVPGEQEYLVIEWID